MALRAACSGIILTDYVHTDASRPSDISSVFANGTCILRIGAEIYYPILPMQMGLH